ncbi:MAG: methionine--tRNA ligase subunit beta, partial [Ignavibacteria bacterium]|nr:methionine--tRNA ligase subunit beta [Ignavibacteria bacterium]
RNWGIDVIDFLKAFPADPLRYTLAANLPEMRDTDFHWKEFQARNNNELSSILGNFINRTFTFVAKNFEGKVPPQIMLEEIDQEMIALLESYPAKISLLFENYKIKDGVLEIMNLARAANKYFNDAEPWKTVKSNNDNCSTTLNICLQTIFTLAELIEPIIPFSSQKIFTMLNTRPVTWDDCGNQHLEVGHSLNNFEILFKKIEDEELAPFLEKIDASTLVEEKTEEPKLTDELISFEDFQKVHLKIAEVIKAEKVAKSEKLLKLQVSLGTEERQIIAGIARQYSPEEIVGKKVVIVANLKPAKLMGMESQGMVLAVEGDGKLNLLNVDPSIPNGTRAK